MNKKIITRSAKVNIMLTEQEKKDLHTLAATVYRDTISNTIRRLIGEAKERAIQRGTWNWQAPEGN